MKKFKIEYETETILPADIDLILNEFKERLFRDIKDDKKPMIHYTSLKISICEWFCRNRKEINDE